MLAMDHAGGVKAERLDAIRSHLYANGFSTIQALANSVGASLATIESEPTQLQRTSARLVGCCR